MRRSRLIVHAATVIALVAGLGLVAAPAAAEDYPTWDEVEAAKQSVAGREAEADRITTLVDGLEQEAGRLGDLAVEAAATAETAAAEHRSAATRAADLRSAADAAKRTADEAAARFARLSSVLARTGGADVAMRLFVESGGAGDADDLLDSLTRGAQLADLAAGLAASAEAAEHDAASLSDQADVAERERARLARLAEQAADEARAAHEAAEARVAEQRRALDTLYAQLASLRDRSVELERRFRIGEQARLEAEARERAAAEAAENAGGGGGGSGGDDAPPPGMDVDPEGAKAYAAGAVGRYGWGSAQFQCLVLLWTRESSWRADAYNASSGAYGIPQSLPGSKMAAAGADWRTNAATQIEWGLSYIAGRYGAPCGAWAHSEQFNWY